jgi:hypothetical protein
MGRMPTRRAGDVAFAAAWVRSNNAIARACLLIIDDARPRPPERMEQVPVSHAVADKVHSVG